MSEKNPDILIALIEIVAERNLRNVPIVKNRPIHLCPSSRSLFNRYDVKGRNKRTETLNVVLSYGEFWSEFRSELSKFSKCKSICDCTFRHDARSQRVDVSHRTCRVSRIRLEWATTVQTVILLLAHTRHVGEINRTLNRQ